MILRLRDATGNGADSSTGIIDTVALNSSAGSARWRLKRKKFGEILDASGGVRHAPRNTEKSIDFSGKRFFPRVAKETRNARHFNFTYSILQVSPTTIVSREMRIFNPLLLRDAALGIRGNLWGFLTSNSMRIRFNCRFYINTFRLLTLILSKYRIQSSELEIKSSSHDLNKLQVAMTVLSSNSFSKYKSR